MLGAWTRAGLYYKPHRPGLYRPRLLAFSLGDYACKGLCVMHLCSHNELRGLSSGLLSHSIDDNGDDDDEDDDVGGGSGDDADVAK